MVHELREAGLDVGRRRVARLMREDGLQAHIKRRFKCTTDSAHSHPVAYNYLNRAFSPTKPNACQRRIKNLPDGGLKVGRFSGEHFAVVPQGHFLRARAA